MLSENRIKISYQHETLIWMTSFSRKEFIKLRFNEIHDSFPKYVAKFTTEKLSTFETQTELRAFLISNHYIEDDISSFPLKFHGLFLTQMCNSYLRTNMALAMCELIWLKHLLRELRFGNEHMKHICYNQAALYIAFNIIFHERTEHIEVD